MRSGPVGVIPQVPIDGGSCIGTFRLDPCTQDGKAFRLRSNMVQVQFRNGFLVAKKMPKAREEVLGRVNVTMSLTQGTAVVDWEWDCQAWENKG